MFSASIKFTGIDAITGPVKRMQAQVDSFAASANTGFMKVGNITSNLGNKVDSLAGKMINFKTVLMGGAVYEASRKLFGMATASAEANYQQLMFARRVGMSIQSVKEMSYALKGQGISMDEGMKWMERFSTKMGQLKLNSGSLYQFLAKNDRNLLSRLKASKSVDQSFGLIADSVKRIQSPMLRAAFVTEAFGQKARTITGLLMQGSSGIAKAREEYRKLMGTTTLSAEAIQKFRKSQMQLNTAFSSVKMAIGMSVIPAITSVMDKARDWFQINGALLKSEIVGWVKLFANAILLLVRNLNIIIPSVLAFVGVLTLLKVVSVAAKVATLAMAAAQYVTAAAMAVAYIATGTITEGLLANSTALGIVTAWEWLATAATTAFSAALWSTGIPEIVIGVIALGVGIYMLIKHWKEITNWIVNSNNAFAVLLRVAIYPFIEAFNGVKVAISWVIEKISQLWGWLKDTGTFKVFAKAFSAAFGVVKSVISWIWDKITSIFGFISKIIKVVGSPALGAIKGISDSVKVDLKKEGIGAIEARPVNKDVSILTQKQIRETSSTQSVQINIDDATGRARIGGQTSPIPVLVRNTKQLWQ